MEAKGRKHLGELIHLVKYRHRIIQLGKNGKADVLRVGMPQLEPEVCVTVINASSFSFAFLDAEPDLDTLDDLKTSRV